MNEEGLSASDAFALLERVKALKDVTDKAARFKDFGTKERTLFLALRGDLERLGEDLIAPYIR